MDYESLLSYVEEIEKALQYAQSSSTPKEEKWWQEEALAFSTILLSNLKKGS